MKETIENALALRETDTIAEPLLGRYPAYPALPGAGDEQVHLRDYWKAVRKRLWLVAGLAVLVTALATMMMLRRHNVYEATARVQVDLESNNPLVSSKTNAVVVSNQVNDPAYFNTQLQILAGPGLLRRAVKTLDLEHNSAFIARMNRRPLWKNLERVIGLAGSNPEQSASAKELPIAAAKGAEETEEAETLAPFVEALQHDLKIEPVKETRLQAKETRLIEISYTCGDPRLSARIVNAIAEAFAAANLDKKNKTGAASGDFLGKRIAELQSQIRDGEQKLIAYGKSNQILSLDPTQNTVVDRLVGLNKQLLEAENDRKLGEAAFRAAQAPGAASALAQENAKNIDDAETKLSDLQQKRAQLLVDNTEEWSEVKEVDQQIATLQHKIEEMKGHAISVVVTNLKTHYEQARDRENALRSSFNQQRGETLTQNEAAINYHIIQQEIETNKNLLDGLLQRAKENDVALAGTPNNISVVDYAITPRTPVGPQRLLGVCLALLVSIVFGICLAIFLDYFDNTVRSSADIEQMLGLPALAIIPSIGGLTRRRFLPNFGRSQTVKAGAQARPELLLNGEARSTIAEAYKQLRTSILLSTAGRAPKLLLITSAKPAEGKTTTAINTAISLAQTGARVLIIDADMRRPMIHNIFNVVNVAGLSTALSRDVNEQDILSLIEFQADSDLHVMTSGPIPPNPAELLGSDQMKKMLETLTPHFDHIVIDSPPITNVTDGVLLAALVDGVIMVVHGGHSTKDLVRRTQKQLRGVGARIFGVVLNNVTRGDDDYYYQDYYRKPYGFESTIAANSLSITE